MIAPLSQAELAFRDTLISKSSGESFDRLARFYDFPRLRMVPEKYWRRALRAIAYGPKGTFGTLHAVLEAIFDVWAEPSFTYLVQLDPTDPQGVLRLNGPPGVYCNHRDRLVRIDSPTLGSRIFRSVDFDTPGHRLVLSDIRTAYWRAADWSQWVEPEVGLLKILPFVYEEPTPGPIVDAGGLPVGTFSGEPCLFRVFVDGDLWYTPPTYLQPAGEERPEGQPFGGQIVDPFDGDPTTPSRGDQIVGPFPLYLPGAEVAGLLQSLLDLTLAAGVRIEFRIKSFCSDEDALNVFVNAFVQHGLANFDWRTLFGDSNSISSGP